MADHVLAPDSSKPCCAKLKQKFLKVKEDRNFLRDGMKIVGERIDKLVKENLHLQKEKSFAEQQLCGKQEKEEMIKEPDIKKKLEKEVHDLKEKISSYQRNEHLISINDDENKFLKACVSEGQDEIRRLKELLEKEKKKSESEKKKAELEKKKADEAWKLVKEEKVKAEEERKLTEVVRKSSEEYKMSYEKAKSEAKELKTELSKSRVPEGQDEIRRLKELLENEKKKAELEKKKADEAWKLVKEEKVKAEEERKLIEVLRKKSEEYIMNWDKAKEEAKELKAELSKVNDARKRVEEDKQKITVEKARAESQTKKLMEAERKKSIGEKTRADYLSQILDEEKRRGEELQKKLDDLESTSKGRYDSCNRETMHSSYVGIMNANMKLLREQLKLEKKQGKYAKRMAKLEQAEKGFIMQEHHLLKHNFMEMASRFNMLDACLSHSIEGTDAVAKIDKPRETHDFKMENIQFSSKRVNHCSRIDCGMRKTCCPTSFNLTEPPRDLVGFSLLRSCSTGPTTGTISELESPIGGSDRNKSQNSAICSNASYSDKRSMGSQERGSIAIAASAKLTEKHPNKKPTVMKLPCEVTKTNKSKEASVVTNKADKSYGCIKVGNACLAASANDANEVVGAEFNRSSKRRKVWDAMLPIATMCAESKQSDFEIGEILAAPEDNLNIECQDSACKCSQGCRISHNCFNRNDHFSEDHNSSATQNHNCSSTIMASKRQTPVLVALGQNINKTQYKKSNSSWNRDPMFAALTTPSHEVRGNICVPPGLISFESIIRGNCLKLLNLDNVADEERYMMAVEMPLSPTLPDFNLPNNQLHVEDGMQCVMERENPVRLHPIDVMTMEINASNASGNLLSNGSQDSLYPAKDSGYNRVIKDQDCAGKHDRLNDVKDNPSFSDKALNEKREFTKDKKNIRQPSEASKQTTLFTSCNAEDTFRVNPDSGVRKAPLWCVASSDIKDNGSISRIFRMRESFSYQDLIDSQIDHVVKQVHSALATNTSLLPQEKGSICFSLLLCNVSSRLSANFKCCIKHENLLPCSESFAVDINKELSDPETKSLLAEICQLDILADIIKGFLMERKVLVYIDRDHECNDLSSSNFQLDGAYVLSRAATVDQFVAGCIILPSISATDFLLEASYEIITRMSTSNVSWILFALHIFATVCGNEFFNAYEYGLLIITLRSVVLLLERGHQSVSPCFHSALDECPFATGAILMDKLANLLLDVLQCYIGSPSLGSRSVRMIPACTGNNLSDASRYIIMFNKHAADLPVNFPARAFCHYTDIVSLMELIGLLMGWEWTKDNIIPRLSKMLEFCEVEEVSIALFVLIGQLGRFGIDTGGNEKKGISLLRCTISVIIDSSLIARKMQIRTQFAAIGALLNLLPLNFRETVGDYKDLVLDASQLGHAKLIKKWYLDLSKHQQSMCLNLFE